jgi:hypothetical protein
MAKYKTNTSPQVRTALDIKELTKTLTDFTPDELRQIPLVPAGVQLKEGAVYLDARNPSRGPFAATAGVKAEEHDLYVPEAEVPHEYWSRLLRSLGPDRVQGDEKSSHERVVSESMIDKTLADSFPTSDPPSWNTGRDKE